MQSVSLRAVSVGLSMAATITFAEAAMAEPEEVCKGCVVVGETGGEPRPLLVVLHGDEGSPTKVLGAWKAAAEKAHVTLFAPRCPASEGCAGSWWRWDGDPAWLLGRVSALEKTYPIDAKHRYLAGWSGGTTYASFHIPAWFPTFAAVSLAGGGAPPHDETCVAHAGGACAPIHYLQGDKNPLFSYAEGAHAYLERCGHAVTWELHAGADHAGEWRAYERETGAILGWLVDHPEGCAITASTPAPSPSALAPSAAPSSLDPSASSRPVDAPPNASAHVPEVTPRIQSEPRCTCTVETRARPSRFAWMTLAGALAWAARRASRRRLQGCAFWRRPR